MKSVAYFFACLVICLPLSSFYLSKEKTFVITDSGAVDDGHTVNTLSIQRAIDQCAEAGGGTVVVPKGTFISGAVFLKQGTQLRLEKGGTLKGSLDEADYPQIDTRWEGEEKKWTACLVNAIGLHDVTVTGPGTLDGSGEEWTAKGRSGTRFGRPRLIGFQNCTRVHASNLSLRNQASWGLFVLYCSEAEISNLHIRAAHNIPSSDGIDIDSGNKIHISNCDIDVNDDCISIKSGKDEDGLRVNRPSENILIEQCRFGYGHGGVAMGSETSGGIRNVVVRNCTADSANWAPVRFKTQPSRSGVVENITYENITLNHTRKAFEFNMAWRMVNPKPAANVLPVVRNIQITRVSGTADAAGDMHGLAGSPISGVKFKDCILHTSKGLVLENTERVDTSGLKIIQPRQQ
ncbi:MAG: glycoside hydrolase family 28 protein [Williamsia sp.]|nr:glycoside hydrolase family 28 protein [Williamsia sp.]